MNFNSIPISIVTGHETDKPKPIFENATTELALGRTNLFLCTVYFTESRFYNLVSARWHIDGVPIEKIHEDPYCFMRPVSTSHFTKQIHVTVQSA